MNDGSNEINPYQASAEIGHAEDAAMHGVGAEVDGRVVALLLQTRPWVRLFAVLLLIGFVALLLGGAGMIIGGAFSNQIDMVGVGLGYLLVGLLYFVPARHLWTYGKHITSLETSASNNDLIAAVQSQKSFWKYCGICFLIYVVVVVLAFVLFAGAMRVAPM